MYIQEENYSKLPRNMDPFLMDDQSIVSENGYETMTFGGDNVVTENVAFAEVGYETMRCRLTCSIAAEMCVAEDEPDYEHMDGADETVRCGTKV